MSLMPVRPAPLPPSAGVQNSKLQVVHHKNDNNNNIKKITLSKTTVKPTVIRPKSDSQPKKKRPPPPRPAPPKLNKYGNGIQKQQISHELQEDLKTIFENCNYDTQINGSKQKSQINPAKKPSRPPQIIRRSIKKRAPNPSVNHNRNTDALIDFDSPVIVSNNDIYKIFNSNLNSANPCSNEKSLLDIDDLFLDNATKQSSDIPKSNSLPVGSTFQTFSSLPMNGMEKCAKYVSSVNSVSESTSLDEQFQKKPLPAPRRIAECSEKENIKHRVNVTRSQPKIVIPSKHSNDKISSNGKVSNICSTEQKNNDLYHTSYFSVLDEKKEDSLPTRTNQSINITWSTSDNTQFTTDVWNHCESPFSDVSSYNTADSNEEPIDMYDCHPEPMFPPPPPPPLAETYNITHINNEENVSSKSVSENPQKFQENCTIPKSESQIQKCKALYDFESQSSDEISFKEGDIIYLENKLTNDWWKGTINGQTGIFPASFVQIINNKGITDSEGKVCLVVALHQFDGEEEGDLCFKIGDEIRVLSRINKDWLFGECGGFQGQFPVSFVKQKQSHEDLHGLCEAKYNFEGENFDELSFQEGDKIMVTEYINNDWWKGILTTDKNKKEGIFPCAFVQKL